MAKRPYRTGRELDEEDALAEEAVGIRRGQIIQTHDAIQEALAARAEVVAGEPELGMAAEIEPEAEEEPAAPIAPIAGEAEPAAPTPEVGFEPEVAAEEPQEGAVPSGAAGGQQAMTGLRAAVTGGTFGLLAAAALGSSEAQTISAPGGGRRATQQQENALKDLLDVQKKVAKVGLPIFGGVGTQAAGSKL